MPTRKVCTFSLKYVLLSCFLYAVRTQYILFRKVCTRYVQGENSTYLVRTWGKKYVPVQSSTRWYSTIDEYNSVRTGAYQVRTTVHNSRCIMASLYLYKHVHTRLNHVYTRYVYVYRLKFINMSSGIVNRLYVLGMYRYVPSTYHAMVLYHLVLLCSGMYFLPQVRTRYVLFCPCTYKVRTLRKQYVLRTHWVQKA